MSGSPDSSIVPFGGKFIYNKLKGFMLFHKQTEASTCPGKLQVVDPFRFTSLVNETNINHEEKVDSKRGVTSNKLTSSPASAVTAEVLCSSKLKSF